MPRRFYAPPPLADIVEHFWQVEWSIPAGESFVQKTIPHPSTHVVFELDRCEVVGPMTGLFTRELVGDGRVFAAKIKPGMTPVLARVPAADLVDRRAPIDEALPLDRAEVDALAAAVLGARDGESAAPLERALLRCVDDRRRQRCREASALVARVEADTGLVRAADLAAIAGCSLRSLQRLFRECVGLSPKQVIQRFRLLEAAERLVAEPAGGAAIAAALGYADQAHFIRAFRDLVGATPHQYARRNARLDAHRDAPS